MFERLLILARALKRIRRGAGTLPDCGPHPGTGVALGLIVGAGIFGGGAGIILALTFVLPGYLCGCHERARLQDAFDRKRAREFIRGYNR